MTTAPGNSHPFVDTLQHQSAGRDVRPSATGVFAVSALWNEWPFWWSERSKSVAFGSAVTVSPIQENPFSNQPAAYLPRPRQRLGAYTLLRPARAAQSIDRSREIQWLEEHRREYSDQWVALDGDILLAAGREAKEVFDGARRSGVSRPLIVHVEPADAPPFGGW